MKRFEITVHGSPAPKGSKSFKGFGRRGDGTRFAILAESSKSERPWADRVTAAIVEARLANEIFFDGAVRLSLAFIMPRGSTEKRATRHHTRAPDLSKLARSVEDAITVAGLWKDDACVIELTCTKRTAELGEPSGCAIIVNEVPAVVQPGRARKAKPQLLGLTDDGCPYFI